MIIKENDCLKRVILGFLIGIAIIIPGLSGSTLAIIFNLYDKILNSVNNIFKKFKNSFLYLLPIIIGAIFGLVIGIYFLKLVFFKIPLTFCMLFSGLMIGSNSIKSKVLTKKNKLLIIIGFLLPIIFLFLANLIKYNNSTIDFNPFVNESLIKNLWLVILGFFLSVTQIVPGLSATSLLMAVGYYKYFVDSLSFSYIFSNYYVRIVYLLLFLGFMIGVFLQSNFLSKFLVNNKNEFSYLINGLSIGSIFPLFLNFEMILYYNSLFNNLFNFIFQIFLGFIFFIIGIKLCKFLNKLEKNTVV